MKIFDSLFHRGDRSGQASAPTADIDQEIAGLRQNEAQIHHAQQQGYAIDADRVRLEKIHTNLAALEAKKNAPVDIRTSKPAPAAETRPQATIEKRLSAISDLKARKPAA